MFTKIVLGWESSSSTKNQNYDIIVYVRSDKPKNSNFICFLYLPFFAVTSALFQSGTESVNIDSNMVPQPSYQVDSNEFLSYGNGVREQHSIKRILLSPKSSEQWTKTQEALRTSGVLNDLPPLEIYALVLQRQNTRVCTWMLIFYTGQGCWHLHGCHDGVNIFYVSFVSDNAPLFDHHLLVGRRRAVKIIGDYFFFNIFVWLRPSHNEEVKSF